MGITKSEARQFLHSRQKSKQRDSTLPILDNVFYENSTTCSQSGAQREEKRVTADNSLTKLASFSFSHSTIHCYSNNNTDVNANCTYTVTIPQPHPHKNIKLLFQEKWHECPSVAAAGLINAMVSSRLAAVPPVSSHGLCPCQPLTWTTCRQSISSHTLC